MQIGLVALVIDDYDQAIDFFVRAAGFELVEDSPSLTNDGRPKRWVVVRPPGAETGLLLARADGAGQAAVVGRQAAGRVGFFLHVADFEAAYARMLAAGVEFVTEPRTEPFGRVAVFVDIAGNKWDLVGPVGAPAADLSEFDRGAEHRPDRRQRHLTGRSGAPERQLGCGTMRM